MFVVDTCVLVDVARGHVQARQWMCKNGSKCLVPSLVYLEVLAPSELNKREKRDLVKIMKPFPKINPTDSDWSSARNCYRDWDNTLKKPGVVDLVIGHIAKGLGAKVATLNVRDFENICEVEIPY